MGLIGLRGNDLSTHFPSFGRISVRKDHSYQVNGIYEAIGIGYKMQTLGKQRKRGSERIKAFMPAISPLTLSDMLKSVFSMQSAISSQSPERHIDTGA